jgi:hypothetical protein
MSESNPWIDPRESREPPQATRLYPDLLRAGSLSAALNHELAKVGSALRSSLDYYGFQSWSWAEVRRDRPATRSVVGLGRLPPARARAGTTQDAVSRLTSRPRNAATRQRGPPEGRERATRALQRRVHDGHLLGRHPVARTGSCGRRRSAVRVGWRQPGDNIGLLGLPGKAFALVDAVHPTGQYSKKCPQVDGHVLHLSGRHAKLRREGYRKRRDG